MSDESEQGAGNEWDPTLDEGDDEASGLDPELQKQVAPSG
jgi:hypothetical protein